MTLIPISTYANLIQHSALIPQMICFSKKVNKIQFLRTATKYIYTSVKNYSKNSNICLQKPSIGSRDSKSSSQVQPAWFEHKLPNLELHKTDSNIERHGEDSENIQEQFPAFTSHDDLRRHINRLLSLVEDHTAKAFSAHKLELTKYYKLIYKKMENRVIFKH